MNFHHVKIHAPGPTLVGCTVELDGVPLKGLRSVTVSGDLDNIHSLQFEIIVDRLDIEAPEGAEVTVKEGSTPE